MPPDDDYVLDDADLTIIDDWPDRTPTDSPESAVRRLCEHQRGVCEAFDRVALLLPGVPRADRPFFLQQFVELLGELERGARECREAVTAQLELETVFRARP